MVSMGWTGSAELQHEASLHQDILERSEAILQPSSETLPSPVQTNHETTSADCSVSLQLDLEKALVIADNTIVEISGSKYVLHIDHDARQVLGIPFKKAQEIEKDVASSPREDVRPDYDPRESERRRSKRPESHTLSTILGRRCPGRPRKISTSKGRCISLLILHPNGDLMCVQIPLEEVPPLLPLSQLCDRVLHTLSIGPNVLETSGPLSMNLSARQNKPLTLNVNLVVMEGYSFQVDEVRVIPVDQSTPVEDENQLAELLAKDSPIVDEILHCSLCQEFSSYHEGHISKHLRRVHEGQGWLACKKCDLAVADKGALVTHYVNRHRSLVCEQCGYVAEQLYQIKRHNERHSEELSTSNRCEVCNKVYKDQYILRAHIRTVHTEAEVFYQCNVCKKQFDRKNHFVRHMKTHEKTKPFGCDQCPYRARERGDLNKHLMTHGEPRFKCSLCGKAFNHLKNMKLHEKRHAGLRDYKCGLCNFFGYTYSEIKKHIERMHAGGEKDEEHEVVSFIEGQEVVEDS